MESNPHRRVIRRVVSNRSVKLEESNPHRRVIQVLFDVG